MCRTNPFAQPASVGVPYTMTIAVGRPVAATDSSQSVTLRAAEEGAVYVTPSSLNPVIKQDLTV